MTPEASTPAPAHPHAPEVVACVVALIGVVDTWLGLWLAPVFWAALMIVGALVLTALRARASRGGWSTHHAALGLLLVAVLQIASIPTGEGPQLAATGHSHGAPLAAGGLPVIASIAAIGYAVLTVLVLPRVSGWRARVPVVAMAAVVLLMAGSVVG
ncbi:hypothetical protein ACIQTT_11950 [Microbacterium sp. NPDC090225]|uniref:hypothetical protein n=1 Tax=Microbacterium sp. NPDC090225 TaxID=3364207 RepID=UPI00380913CE